MLHGEQLSGAAEAGLHFIGDQQDAVLIANGAQRLDEVRRRHIEATLALHRLEDDGGHALGIHVGLEQVLHRLERILHRHAMQRARVRRMEDLARERAKAHLVRHYLAGQRHAHHGAAVEAAGEGNDAGAAGSGAGDLDGVLHRLGARGEESGLLGAAAWRALVDPLGQLDIAGVRHDLVGGVREALELALYGFDQARMTVAGVEHGDAGGKVDIALAFHVPDLRVLGTLGVEVAHHANATGRGGILAANQFGILHLLLHLE